MTAQIMFPSRWREIGGFLGLEYDEQKSHLHGERDGHRVVCMAASGGEYDVYEIAISFRESFDILRGVVDSFDPFSIRDMVEGMPEGQRRRALERAVGLVGSPPPPSIARMRDERASLRVRDDRLLIGRRMDDCPLELLRWLVDHGVELANALEARRCHIPVLAELAPMEHPFRAAASDLGLSFTPEPLRVEGTIDDVPAVAVMVPSGQDWQLVVIAEFPATPPVEVQIGPHVSTWLERIGLSSQTDVAIGDRELDDALAIQSNAPAELRARLGHVFESMRALVGAGHLTIQGNVVLKAKPLGAPVGELVRHAASVARALGTTRRKGGPFR